MQKYFVEYLLPPLPVTEIQPTTAVDIRGRLYDLSRHIVELRELHFHQVERVTVDVHGMCPARPRPHVQPHHLYGLVVRNGDLVMAITDLVIPTIVVVAFIVFHLTSLRNE